MGHSMGHSMGGIINKTMVISSEYQLWDATYTLRPDELLQQSSDYEMEKYLYLNLFLKKTLVSLLIHLIQAQTQPVFWWAI